MTVIDWCARHSDLIAIRDSMVTGKAVKVARFGEDEVERFKGDPDRLDKMIDEAARECSRVSGRPHTPRRRALTF